MRDRNVFEEEEDDNADNNGIFDNENRPNSSLSSPADTSTS